MNIEAKHELQDAHDALISAVREFCDYYKGKEHLLGNGRARRSLDKFRAALAGLEAEGVQGEREVRP